VERVAQRAGAVKYRFSTDFREAVRIRGLTAAKLACLAHVAPATVAAALSGHELRLDTALRIAKAVSDAPVVPALETWSGSSLDDQ